MGPSRVWRSVFLSAVAVGRRAHSSGQKTCPDVSGVVRSTAASGSQVYESKRAVDEYLLFHYGDARDIMPYGFGPTEALQFPKRLAEVAAKAWKSSSIALNDKTAGRRRRALDIGCAVGGSAFELARYFDEVVGVDFSQHFIDAANEMKVNGTKSFEMMKQGQIFVPRTANVPTGVDRTRIQFQQGDACNMNTSLGKFDVILASNLLCRLPSPRKFVDGVGDFLTVGGHLILVSPYSWLHEYTEEKEWFGAQLDAQGQSVESFSALRDYITKRGLPLKLVEQYDMSFLIREHERKFQYGVSDVTIWEKQ